MNKFVTTLAAGVALVAIAAPAHASNHSGGRIEALVGWDHPSLGLDDFGLDGNINSDGIVFGIGAGYDFAVGPTASIGIDLEASESTADFDFDDGVDTAEIAAGRDLYVGGRATFVVSPTANVYVKAGYTNARFRAELNGNSESANADGVRGGIGAQFALGGNAYVGGEYRYSNYEADLSRHQAVLTFGFRM